MATWPASTATLIPLRIWSAISFEDMERNIRDAVLSIYRIEDTLIRREPTISRWEGLYMANTERWYYAYRIDDDTITVVDACHAQNMHE